VDERVTQKWEREYGVIRQTNKEEKGKKKKVDKGKHK